MKNLTSESKEIEFLKKEIDEIKERLDRVEKGVILLKPMTLSDEQKKIMDNHKKHLKWIEKQKQKFKNKIIAYVEDHISNSWEVIAAGSTEEELYKQLDKIKLEDKTIKFLNLSDSSEIF